MARTKTTVRRMPVDVMVRGRLGKRTYPYKIKLPLLEQRTVNIKKNSQIIKTINVRTNSKYFSTKNVRIF